MRYRIDGTVMQTLTVELDERDALYAETGSMAWMSDNIEMKTEVKGGVMAGLGRMFAGESFFLTTFKSKGKGAVTFATEYPGKIIPIELKEGQSVICEKDAFLCAQESVQLKVHFRRKLTTGLFGGEGFVLNQLTGPGTAFVNFGGEIVEMNLQPGQKMLIDTGCIAMFEPAVKFDITMMRGVRNILFGGEGLFLAILEGPGKIWLQSMPVSTLAGKIKQYLGLKG